MLKTFYRNICNKWMRNYGNVPAIYIVYNFTPTGSGSPSLTRNKHEIGLRKSRRTLKRHVFESTWYTISFLLLVPSFGEVINSTRCSYHVRTFCPCHPLVARHFHGCGIIYGLMWWTVYDMTALWQIWISVLEVRAWSSESRCWVWPAAEKPRAYGSFSIYSKSENMDFFNLII